MSISHTSKRLLNLTSHWLTYLNYADHQHQNSSSVLSLFTTSKLSRLTNNNNTISGAAKSKSSDMLWHHASPRSKVRYTKGASAILDMDSTTLACIPKMDIHHLLDISCPFFVPECKCGWVVISKGRCWWGLQKIIPVRDQSKLPDGTFASTEIANPGYYWILKRWHVEHLCGEFSCWVKNSNMRCRWLCFAHVMVFVYVIWSARCWGWLAHSTRGGRLGMVLIFLL